MAEGKTPTKIDVGIYRTKAGHRVFQRVAKGKGGLKSATFPATATLTAMKAWQEDQRVEARKQPQKVTKADRGTLAADIQSYLRQVQTMPSLKDRTRDLQAWADILGMRPRHELTRDDFRVVLQEWRLSGRKGKPLAASTVNHRRTALMHLYALLDGKGAENPLRDIAPFHEPPPEPRDIGLQNVLAILTVMKPSKSRARLKVLAWTGIRGRSELGKMKAEHVDRAHGVCWVPTGKHGKPRTLPLSPAGCLAWQEFAALNAWGTYQKDSLRHAFQRAVLKVNQQRAKRSHPELPAGLRVYDLRHTIATALRRSGADLADVQAYLGHTSQRMTQRYAPYSSVKLRAALEGLH